MRFLLKTSPTSVAPFIVLLLLTISIAISDFTLFLPLEADIKQYIHIVAIGVAIAFLFLSKLSQSILLNKVYSSLVFVFLFSMYAYAQFLDVSSINYFSITALFMLLFWHGVHSDKAHWVSLFVVIVSLVVFKVYSNIELKIIIIYLLLFLTSISLAWAGWAGSDNVLSASNTDNKKEDEFCLDSISNAEPVIDIEPEIAMVNVDVNNSYSAWDKVLKDLHNELKSIHDVDNLFNRMLVFMSDTIEFDAAAVGMVQDNSINKISTYGPENFLHQKELNWNSHILNELKIKDEIIISYQDSLNDKGEAIKLYRLDAPILSNNKLIGLLTVFRQSVLFDDRDSKLTSAILFHSMIALRYARLQEEVKRLSGSGPNKILYSREQFIEKANIEIDQLDKPRQFSLFIIEIDDFDLISEKYNLNTAMAMLKKIAVNITSVLDADDFLGRYGKDGFIVLLHEKDLLEAKKIAENIRKKISLIKYKIPEGIITTTVSIGLTTISEQPEDIALLIRKADMGLFLAKESGRNTVKVSL